MTRPDPRRAGSVDEIEGHHERCCEGADPTCDSAATCAERAWREVARLRVLYGRDRLPATGPPAGETGGEIDRLQRWQYDACVAIHAATIIGQRHGVGLNYANHDRLLDEAGWGTGERGGSGQARSEPLADGMNTEARATAT